MTGFLRAIRALEDAGIPFSFRKGVSAPDALPALGEVDIQLDRAEEARADRAIRSAGFRPLRAPGHGGHRFYLAFEGGWLKLDVKLRGSDAGRKPWAVLPPSWRRAGPVVAVLGPDGAGKGTLIEALAASIPLGVHPLYLGMDRARQDGGRGGDGAEAEPGKARHGAAREMAGLVYRVLRAWRMLLPGYAAAWMGHVVLCDRHPIEVLAVRPERTRPGRAFERFAARRLLPWPDAIVILDAPGRVLFERKGEHSAEVLERWRRGYADAFGPRATVVSTIGSKEESLSRAASVVWTALSTRRRW